VIGAVIAYFGVVITYLWHNRNASKRQKAERSTAAEDCSGSSARLCWRTGERI